MEVLTPDDIDFEKYMAETEPAEKVRPASAYLNEVMHILAPADAPEKSKNPKLPFADAWLEFAPGEVTVWGGFNGSGKSALQGQVMTGIAKAGQTVCIASFEMTPAKTLARIMRQEFGYATPTKDQVSSFMKQTDGKIWLYDQQGTIKSERMIAVIKHCAEKLKVKHIAIDSLMKCVRGTDDYNSQKDFVDMLTSCARDYNIHIHLVVHLKKGEGDERMPTRMDISGTAAISDLVDNVLLVWRNKRKERDRDAGKEVDENTADALLICDKNRNGDWEGRVKLWYDRAALKFSDFNKNARRGIARGL
jgi:twinkle protein